MSEACAEVVATTGRAVLVRDHIGGDRIKPGQRGIGDAVAATPCHGEGVGDRFLGSLAPRDPPYREGEQPDVMLAEAAFEAAAVDVLLRRIVDWKHLRANVR